MSVEAFNRYLSLLYFSGADGGNGGADIFSKQTFDRELQKFYYLPIKMWDKRDVTGDRSMTGTNTLTIEIGDVNDNVHGPGTQNIHVYNYLGKFYNVFISCFLFLACIRHIMAIANR